MKDNTKAPSDHPSGDLKEHDSAQADSCDVSYKFLFDRFEIRGQDWEATTLKEDGSRLLKELQRCGPVNDWSFELTPDDVKHQPYATAPLPIGSKACVGHAGLSAGGPPVANCRGPG